MTDPLTVRRIRQYERIFEFDLNRHEEEKREGNLQNANQFYRAAAQSAAILTALRNKTVLMRETVHIPMITTWKGKDVHELTGEEAQEMVRELWPKKDHEQDRKDFEAGLISINEYRRRVGLKPLEQPG